MKQILSSDSPFNQNAIPSASLPSLRGKQRLIPYNAQREDVSQQPNQPLPEPVFSQPGLSLPPNYPPRRTLNRGPLPKLVQNSIDSTQPSGSLLEESTHLENNFVGSSKQAFNEGPIFGAPPGQETGGREFFEGGNMRREPGSAASTRSEKKTGSLVLNNLSPENMVSFSRRLREMEKQLSTIRPEMERIIIQSIQENPKELAEALKTLETNELNLWSDNSKKHQNSQNEIGSMKEMMRQTRDGLLEAIKGLNKRMDGMEHRTSGIEKTVSGIGKRLAVVTSGYLQGDGELVRSDRKALTDGTERQSQEMLQVAPGSSTALAQRPFGGDTRGTELMGMSNEINLLREALQKEKASKDTFVRDLTNQFNDIHQVVFKNEREYFERLNAQREEFLKEANFTREHLRQLEEARMNRSIGDSEYMKTMITQVERKISDEIQRRIAMDFDNQEWIEQRFKKIKDEMVKDQRKSLSDEYQFINNIKETIKGLNEIIQNTKSQLETSILTTQTMSMENVSNLSSALESLKDAMFTKMNSNDITVNELSSNMAKINAGFSAFSKQLREHTDSDLSAQRTKMTNFYSEVEKEWKTLKNQIKIKEQKQDEVNKEAQEETKKVSEALKKELQKLQGNSIGQNDSLNKRIENFRQEMDQKQGMFERLYQHLETQIKKEEKAKDYKFKELAEQVENKVSGRIVEVLEKIVEGDKEVVKIGEENLKNGLKNVENALRALEDAQKAAWKSDIDAARVKLQQNMDEQKKDLSDSAKRESQRINECIDLSKKDLREKVAELKKYIASEGEKRKEEQNQLSYSLNEKLNQTFEGIRNYTREVASDIRQDFDNLMSQAHEKAEIELSGAKDALNRQIEKVKSEVTSAAAKGVSDAMDTVEEKLKAVHQRITDSNENTKKALELQKNMLLEDIGQRAEQMKSLLKALISEETAERLKADENLMQMINSSIASVKELFNGLMDQMRSEFMESLDDMDKKFTASIEETKNWVSKELADVREKAEQEHVEREAAEYMDYVYASLYNSEEEVYREHMHKNLQVIERQNLEAFERIDKNAQRIEVKLDENISRLTKTDEELLDEIKKINELQKRAKEDSTQQLIDEKNERKAEENRIREQIQEVDRFMTSEIVALDGELKKTATELQVDIQSRDYAQRLYAKLMEEDMSKRFLMQRNSLKELEQVFDQFEEKTDKNFKVAEKTINNLMRTTNHLDAQFYMEYLECRASFSDIEQRMRLEFGNVNDKIELYVEEIEQKIMRILKEDLPQTMGGMSQERQKDQSAVEKRLSKLAESIEKVSGNLDTTISRVSEQENTTSIHEKRIDSNENKIRQIKGLEAETYVLRVTTKNSTVSLGDQLREDITGVIDLLQEIYDRVISAGGSSGGGGASNIVIEEKIQETLEPLALRLTSLETNLDRKSQQIDNLMELIDDMKHQLQNNENKFSKARKAEIEKEKAKEKEEEAKRQKLEEEQATKEKLQEAEKAKKELESKLEMENKRKQDQAEKEKVEEELRKKEQEGKSEIEKARLDIDALFAKNKELKEQLESLRDQLEREKEKSAQLQETITKSDIERRMKKISDVKVEELREDVEKFKKLLGELEADKKEREKLRNDLSAKLNEVNGNLDDMRQKMRKEIENSSNASLQKFKKMNTQLNKMIGNIEGMQKNT